MRYEGGLKGKRLDYPFVIKKVEGIKEERITVGSLDQLIEIISKEMADGFSKDKKLSQICEEVGLFDTLTLLDEQTAYLMAEYNYYSNSATPPAPYDDDVWFDTVSILSKFDLRL